MLNRHLGKMISSAHTFLQRRSSLAAHRSRATLPSTAQLPTFDVSKTASQTPASARPKPRRSPPSRPSRRTFPSIEIVKKFGDRELEFKKERDNYTYTQTFVVQTIDFDGRPDGEYRMTSDILFTPDGKALRKGRVRAAADVAAYFALTAGPRRPRARATVRSDIRRIAEVRRELRRPRAAR